ncbi:MAG: VOC family protein [Pseudomonadota bacterium]
MAASAELSGIRGTQQIGIAVPDVDEAVEFLVDVIGCEAFFSFGPSGPLEDGWMEESLNENARAVTDPTIMVHCGNGPTLEGFKYTSPDQDPNPPKNSYIGGYHIAFYADRINAAIVYLRVNGVRVLERLYPLTVTGLEGVEWFYFQAPRGIQ